jgi:hypothetical protein
MENFPQYGVVLVAAAPAPPPITRASLTPYALTCCQVGSEDKTQQHYYKAEQVAQVLAADDDIINSQTREIDAQRQYIDTLLSDLLANPDLPESIQKSLYAQRQTLIVAKEAADA